MSWIQWEGTVLAIALAGVSVWLMFGKDDEAVAFRNGVRRLFERKDVSTEDGMSAAEMAEAVSVPDEAALVTQIIEATGTQIRMAVKEALDSVLGTAQMGGGNMPIDQAYPVDPEVGIYYPAHENDPFVAMELDLEGMEGWINPPVKGNTMPTVEMPNFGPEGNEDQT